MPLQARGPFLMNKREGDDRDRNRRRRIYFFSSFFFSTTITTTLYAVLYHHHTVTRAYYTRYHHHHPQPPPPPLLFLSRFFVCMRFRRKWFSFGEKHWNGPSGGGGEKTDANARARGGKKNKRKVRAFSPKIEHYFYDLFFG